MFRAIVKPFRDLASVLYDDLDFKVMSLPRVGTALITLLIVWLVVDWLRTRVECPYFGELCALCGALWGTYLFKRRGNPPEETYSRDVKGGAGDVDEGCGMDREPQVADSGGAADCNNGGSSLLQGLISAGRAILAKVGVCAKS